MTLTEANTLLAAYCVTARQITWQGVTVTEVVGRDGHLYQHGSLPLAQIVAGYQRTHG